MKFCLMHAIGCILLTSLERTNMDNHSEMPITRRKRNKDQIGYCREDFPVLEVNKFLLSFSVLITWKWLLPRGIWCLA